MATPKVTKNIQPSLLDRLIDLDPESRVEAAVSRAESLRQFRLAVKRDLEWLLNTRKPPLPELEARPVARETVINFGLPDISALGLSSPSDQRSLRLAIEACVRAFEPRLADVRVTLESTDTTDRRLRFHIEGNMKLDPAPEEITFDTVLELTSGEYKVK